MAGDVRAKREVAYLFVPAVGKKVIDLGGNVEKGQWLITDPRTTNDFDDSTPSAPTLKLLGNSLVLGSIELMGEIMTLADKSGIGSEHVSVRENSFHPY
jgi:hypothetical protein